MLLLAVNPHETNLKNNINLTSNTIYILVDVFCLGIIVRNLIKACVQHFLVHHLSWYMSVKLVLQSKCFGEVFKKHKTISDTCPTAHARFIEAVGPHFERRKSLSDQVSFDIVEGSAQLRPRSGGQISAAIDEEHLALKMVFLGQSLQECSGWIGASSPEKFDIDNELTAH